MFGYVRPHKAEMRVREYEQYKGIYCELCRELGKSFGIPARFTLSYDCTFYTMLALAVAGSSVCGKKARCTVNPLKKCNFIEAEGDAYKKAAALSVIMTRYKLQDDIDDEPFLKSIPARAAKLVFARGYRKARKAYPFMEEIVRAGIEDQTAAEAEVSPSIDRCAEPTAKMLSAIFSELREDEGQKRVLENFGYFLGRWVYLIDAADDLPKDLLTGSFNPFIKKLSLETEKIPPKKEQELFKKEIRDKTKEACNEVLNRTVSMMIQGLQLIELKQFSQIIENIITMGLPEMQRETLFMHLKERKNDRSV
jgi:hypothetical protein